MRFVRWIALLLAAVLTLGGPMQVLADNRPLYISDVMVGMGETAEQARQALIDAGYTVLDNNLNEGAGSVFKTEKFVYLGYKTTADPNEAITDLAVMNMNGGYSFSDYEVLMDKYRDSQIRPFVDRFLAAIREYRDNYESDAEGNRAKAAYAHAILNHIREDDSGSLMGDLLLNPTKEELGLTDEEYRNLPDEEKANTVDLTTALMQGNAEVVLLMEQTLAMAADTNETTWLQRLSELGPEGLNTMYAEAGVRPADASREMAALYNDTARVLLSGWEDTRAALLNCGAANADGDSGEEADPSDLLLIGVEDVEPKEVDILEPTQMLGMINDSLEASLDIAENVTDDRMAAVCAMLRETPYGDGTMYDFFTLPYAEVGGENISALYPMVSTLTEGQIAAIDFLPLEVILQIGANDGESYVDCGTENSDLLQVIEKAGLVSVYLNVNREIFGKTTALTSEALREQALSGNGWTGPDSDLWGLSRLTALSWAATGVALAVTLVTAVKASGAAAVTNTFTRMSGALKRFTEAHTQLTSGFNLSFTDKSGNLVDLAAQVAENTKFTVSQTGTGLKLNYFCDTDSIWSAHSDVLDMDAMTTLSEYGTSANHSMLVSADPALASQIDTQVTSTQELATQLDDKIASANATAKSWSTWRTAGTVITALLTIGSILLTAYDLYRYYNVNYTPIPKYIVDEADITFTDENGNQLVVRNDTAYYTVASTNRPETHEQYKSLQDYADLNGDVGKEWLALYYAKQTGGEPILASSLKVVTGSTSLPEGYTRGIHMFGSRAAANLTDSRYTYDDDLNGIYVYYRTEAPVTAAASVFSGGVLALVGAGSAAAGAALGAAGSALLRRKKTAPAA